MNLLLVVVGIFCVVISIYDFIFRRKIRKNGESTEAVVVKIERKQSSRSVSYSPIVNYSVGGQEHEVEIYTWQHKEKYKIGDIIKIIYDKKNPQKAIMENDKCTNIPAIIWLILGITFLCISLVGMN